MNVVSATVVATVLIQAGYFLWKVAALRHPSPDRPVVALITDGPWLCGLLSTSLGWVFFVWAMSLGDISFVQPLMSAGDFVLVLLAVVFLKERLGRFEWSGVVLTLLGAVVLTWGASGPHASGFYRTWVGGMIFGVVLATAVLWQAQRRTALQEAALAALVGLAFGCGSVLTKAMTSEVPQAASNGTWTQFASPMLIAVVAANAVGLVLLQIAFRRGRAAVIIPLQLAAGNAVAVAAGYLLFNETITGRRAVAILLIVAGTALMQTKRQPEKATPRLTLPAS